MRNKGSVGSDFRRIDRATADKRMVPGSFNRNFQEIAVKIAAPTKNPKVHMTPLERSIHSAYGSQARCGAIDRKIQLIQANCKAGF